MMVVRQCAVRIFSIVFVVAAGAIAHPQTFSTYGLITDEKLKLMPARLYITSIDGTGHVVATADKMGTAVPYEKTRAGGRSKEVHTTLSAHPFHIKLSRRAHFVRIERGLEYHPTTGMIYGGSRDNRYMVKRWINMAKLGWYSGDTHVHRKVENLPNIMLAEDLNVALPLTNWVTQAYVAPSDSKKGNAKFPAKLIKVDETHVIYPVNTEYELFTVNGKRHTQGAVFVLNHKQQLTLPAPPVEPIAKAAREQGALLDLDKHSWPWSMMIVPLMNVDLFELSNNHVWRTRFGFPEWTIEAKADYMGVETTKDGWTEWGWVDFGFQNYYALLNCGFRMRPTAGTASGVHPVPLGFGRVYVHMPKGFNYDGWIKGLNKGRSFVSTGPMLRLEFNDRPHGERFQLAAGTQPKCRITGIADSRVPLDRIEVIVNGTIARKLKPENRPTDSEGFRSKIDLEMTFPGSAWVAVRCFEKSAAGRVRFAHTSPAYYDVAGDSIRPRRAEVEYLIGLMEREINRNKNVLRANELDEYRRALAIYQRLAKTARD